MYFDEPTKAEEDRSHGGADRIEERRREGERNEEGTGTTERIRGSVLARWRHKPYLYLRVFQAYKNGAVIRGTPRLSWRGCECERERERERERVRERERERSDAGVNTRIPTPVHVRALRLNTHQSTSYTRGLHHATRLRCWVTKSWKIYEPTRARVAYNRFLQRSPIGDSTYNIPIPSRR